jgi:diguanylate cyclase (GGDEF)-like protein
MIAHPTHPSSEMRPPVGRASDGHGIDSSLVDLAKVAALVCDAPFAVISLIEDGRVCIKAQYGLTSLPETLSKCPVCSPATPDDCVFVIEDAGRGECFGDSPLAVDETPIHFFAASPVLDSSRTRIGTLAVLDDVARPLTAERRDALRVIAIQISNLLRLRGASAQVRRLGTDTLTGVHSRPALDARLSEEFDRASRYERPLSLFKLDIDHFKLFNDAFGRRSGDEAIKTIADVLTETCRTMDVVARHGGGEFVVILPETDAVGSMVAAERCRKAIALYDWRQRPVTVSIGVASMRCDSPSADSLLNEADDALYRSKRSGRNRCGHSDILLPLGRG